MTKNDMMIRMDSPNKDSEEFKFLSEKGWKVKREEGYCTDDEMYKFLDKNGPSDMEQIQAAFPKHKEDDLRHAIGSLLYTAHTVDAMNGLKGIGLGVFVTAKHQKNWAEKIQKHRNANKPVSMCDLPNPDVEPVSTCENKPKVLDIIHTKSNIQDESVVVEEVRASMVFTKVVQREIRNEIMAKATKEHLHDFNQYINSLEPKHKCYWNEYLDDFRRKLILTEIRKRLPSC